MALAAAALAAQGARGSVPLGGWGAEEEAAEVETSAEAAGLAAEAAEAPCEPGISESHEQSRSRRSTTP